MVRRNRPGTGRVRHPARVRSAGRRLRRRPGVSQRRGGRAGRQLGRGGRVLPARAAGRAGSAGVSHRAGTGDAERGPGAPDGRPELQSAGDLAGALIEYRQAYALDPSNGEAGVQIANLQQELRERIEAARAPAPIEAMRAQARQETQPTLLDPASDELLVLEFADTNLRDILDFLGDASGINVTYDEDFEDEPASLNLGNVTFEEALVHLLSSYGAFYKVVNPTTILVVPDTPQKRAEYDDQAIRTFYISHGDVEELVALLTAGAAHA